MSNPGNDGLLKRFVVGPPSAAVSITYGDTTVEWFGYATVRIEGPDGFVIYFDPGRYGVLEDQYPKDGDVVCVTHDHHYDSDGIERVSTPDATVVVYEAVDADGIDRDVEPVADVARDVRRVGDENHLSVGPADVFTVPTHNDPDGPHTNAHGDPYHPAGFGCGYRITLGDTAVFWPGDGDALDGFAELDVDVFLANIGGNVVSNAAESADLAERMTPGLVVPVHYDTFDLLAADGEGFAADVASRGVPVALDERGVA